MNIHPSPIPVTECQVGPRRLAFEIIDHVAPWRSEPRETIILHHGVGVDRGIWAGWLPNLVDRFRIVSFDMFGCGQSGDSEDDKDWSTAARVADLLGIADRLQLDNFHLIGESYGGTIALLFASQYPARVKSLTVCNASHRGASVRSLDGWRGMIADGGVPAWSRHMMGQRFFEGALSAEQADWFGRTQSNASAHSVLRILESLRSVEITAETLAEITSPTLLLHGDSSPFIPVSLMGELHAGLPDSQMQVFMNARHGLPFSHSSECSQAFRNFAAGLASRK